MLYLDFELFMVLSLTNFDDLEDADKSLVKKEIGVPEPRFSAKFC